MQKQKLLLYGTQMKALVDMLSAGTTREDRELVLRMEGEYKSLLSEQSFSNGMLASHLKKSILPAVAAYKTLIADGKTKEQAFEAVRASVLSDSEKQKKAFVFALHAQYKLRVFLRGIRERIEQGFHLSAVQQ